MKQNTYYCPQTHTALFNAEQSVLTAFNEWISQNDIMNQKGDRVLGPITDLLVNETHNYAYQIQNDIPQLIPALSISLEGLNMGKSVD